MVFVLCAAPASAYRPNVAPVALEAAGTSRQYRRSGSWSPMLTHVGLDPGRVIEWPATPKSTEAPARVAVITVNHNTRLLVAQLIYSLCARLGNQFSQLIVVDNASTDGSRELIERMSDSGLCELIANAEQLYHGPALNQAMNRLAERQTVSSPEELIDYVWVLDSDCMVIRADTLSEATHTLQRTGAALAGQASANQWHAEETIGLYSLLFDPSLVWRDPIAPFEDTGEPSLSLQLGAAAAGLSRAEFPFTRGGYVVHLGRSTLAGVLSRGETDNKFYEWAVNHHEPHFNTEPGAVDLYRAFQAEFAAACGDPKSDAAIVRACVEIRRQNSHLPNQAVGSVGSTGNRDNGEN